MFNDLTTTDHACITPQRIDSASALPGSRVERHLTAQRDRHFMGRSTGIGHGRDRRRAAAGHGCRRCWSRRRHRSQSTPSCRGGGQRPGLCDWRQGWERSGTHARAGRLGGSEVRRYTRGLTAGRLRGRVDGRVAARLEGPGMSWLDLAGLADGCVDTKHCPGKSYPDWVSFNFRRPDRRKLSL
jgi:hypothetical protein